MAINRNFESFQYFNLETDFLENESLLKKLENRFLIKTISIENVLFLYKTSIVGANVNRNRMVRTKWTYHKERSVASNYLIFLKY